MSRLLIFALFLFLTPQAFAATYKLQQSFGETFDTVLIRVYKGTTLLSSVDLVAKDSLNRTFSLPTDTICVIAVFTKNVGDDGYAPMYTIVNQRYSAAAATMKAPIESPFTTDSINLYSIVAGTSTFVDKKTGKSWDTSLTVSANQAQQFEWRIFPTYGTPQSMLWSLWHDTTGGGGGVPSPPLANLCTLYGYVLNSQGGGVPYANVTVTYPDQASDSCSGGTPVLVRSVADETSSTGYWQVYVIKSKCLKGKAYTLSIEIAGNQKIERKVVVPDSTTHKVVW